LIPIKTLPARPGQDASEEGRTMELKDILVHVDATERAETRLRLAAELARRHRAHLTGLHVVDLMLPSGFIAGAGGFGDGAALGALMDEMRATALSVAGRVEARFRATLQGEGIEGEWRVVEGVAAETVALHARYADLVVVGQHDPEGEARDSDAIIERALFSSGRPVLIVPFAGEFKTIGRTVLVGWNASREAARAVHDALPLIAQAEQATVLSVNPRVGLDAHGEVPGADIALHLARHGVTVTVAKTASEEVGEGDVLLNHAADTLADLLVVGAYGHSRVREYVVGGVTRTLLQRMTLPVLMSH
jgi:nucleotide-binding universal stress UspA family protein